MNYLTEERQNALASEYVLGTLQGPARIRFQRLLMQHDPIRHTLWRWENRLNAMGGALPPLAPPPQLWEKIQARLGFNNPAVEQADNVVPMPQKPPQSTPPAQQPRRWHWLAGLSTAAAVLFAVLLIWPHTKLPEVTAPSQVAVVQSEKAEALWLIEMDEDSLNVQATTKLPPQTDKDYELWMVAADGRPPVSLGLLPKTGKLELPRIALMNQVQIAALAVSLEPLGGSPNGQPTTVLYTAELVTL